MLSFIQNCYFHKTIPLSKFCTAKQCTLPLCQKCQSVHINQHQKSRTQPQIIFLQTAKDQAIRQLQYKLNLTQNTKSDMQKQLKLQKQKMISFINQYFVERQQKLKQIFIQKDVQSQKLQQKLKKIKKGSLKTLIFFYSDNSKIKDSLKKFNQNKQIYDQNILKQFEYIIKANLQSHRNGQLTKQLKQTSHENKMYQKNNSKHYNQKVPQFIKAKNSNNNSNKNLIEKIEIPQSQSFKALSNINARSQRSGLFYKNRLSSSPQNLSTKQKKYYEDIKKAIESRYKSSQLSPNYNPKKYDKIQLNCKQNRPKSCYQQKIHQSKDYKNILRDQQAKIPSFLKKDHEENHKNQYQQRINTEKNNYDLSERLNQIRNKHKSTEKLGDKSLNCHLSINQIQMKYHKPNFKDNNVPYKNDYKKLENKIELEEQKNNYNKTNQSSPLIKNLSNLKNLYSNQKYQVLKSVHYQQNNFTRKHEDYQLKQIINKPEKIQSNKKFSYNIEDKIPQNQYNDLSRNPVKIINQKNHDHHSLKIQEFEKIKGYNLDYCKKLESQNNHPKIPLSQKCENQIHINSSYKSSKYSFNNLKNNKNLQNSLEFKNERKDSSFLETK